MQQEKHMQNDANMLSLAARGPQFSFIKSAQLAITGALACAIPVAIVALAQTSTTASTKAAKDRAETTQSAQETNTFKTETSGYTNEGAPLTFTLLAQTSNEASADAKRLLEMQLTHRFKSAVAKITIAELSTPTGQSAFAQKVCRDPIIGATSFTGISCTIGPVQKL